MKKRISLYNMKKAGEHITPLLEKSNTLIKSVFCLRLFYYLGLFLA